MQPAKQPLISHQNVHYNSKTSKRKSCIVVLVFTLFITAFLVIFLLFTYDWTTLSSSLEVLSVIWIIYIFVAIMISCFCICNFGLCGHWCQSEKYDALTEDVYGEILSLRGYNADKVAMGDNRPLKLLVLRADLNEKIIWHNNWKYDFMIYLRNEHTLFSTCFAHSMHPFSRNQRRAILVAIIISDFAIAAGISYGLSLVNFDDTTDWILDQTISYIFGVITSILEFILVAFAVCSHSEKCPTVIRCCCKGVGNFVLLIAVFNSLLAFIVSISLMIVISSKENSGEFWELFALNFFIGVFQAWFFIDLIVLIIKFRKEWKESHPKPKPFKPEFEEENKEKSILYKCCKCFSYISCLWCWCIIFCCCKKKEGDPYDDGQDEFGVNYKEYLAWKNNEDIGTRELPHKYQGLSTDEIIKNVHDKIDDTKLKTVNSLSNTVKSVGKTADEVSTAIDQTKDNIKKVKQKAFGFGNKLKEKKLEYQMKYLYSKSNENY